MLQSINNLTGMALKASDGVIGEVDQFYFDDASWAIRYLVADIGSWFSGKKVLISPVALSVPTEQGLAVNITREEVRNSPDIDTDKPVSREKEEQLHRHYGWAPYWGYPSYHSSFGTPILTGAPYGWGNMPKPENLWMPPDAEKKGSNLRSTKEIIGYGVQAQTGDIGTLEDFLVDVQEWVFRYYTIDLRGLLPKRNSVLPVFWTKRMDWSTKQVFVDLDAEVIKNGPSYDSKIPPDQEFEKRINAYYGRQHELQI